jgi:hypothetical protein
LVCIGAQIAFLSRSIGGEVNAIERQQQSEESVDHEAKASEPPSSGIRRVLLVPRPTPRALPGKEVLPAPGVPETPRRERNKTSSFWPAPPEPMRPARPSKRGSPLTTTTHGFPEANLRAGATAARRSAPPPRPRVPASEVERPIAARPKLAVEAKKEPRELERVPPPPPSSKRKHTDQGWPPPSVAALDCKATDPRPRSVDPAAIVDAAIALVTPVVLDAQPEAGQNASVESAAIPAMPAPAANDVGLVANFDDDEIELPLTRTSSRARWIALTIVVALALAALAVLGR